jgi:fructokinase
VLADLKRWNVHTEFLLQEEHGTTPVIIVRLNPEQDGSMSRRFEWKHPSSGEWLPRYRPVPKIRAEGLSSHLPVANVFYFDRVEPSSLLLATLMRSRGAIVVFEPSSTGNAHLFSACLAISDIVKYSFERLPAPPESPNCRSPRLEIQTLSSEGLRFRLKSNSTTPGSWHHLGAYSVEQFCDATGCGDWCSAGLIDKLCMGGRDEFLSLEEDAISDALAFGQALAAVNCQFWGARGPMYRLTKEQVLDRAAAVRKIGRLTASSPRHCHTVTRP